MDVMMRIIKPSVSIPDNTKLLHRTKFKIGSLPVQQSGPLSFPIYHIATTTTRLVPILSTNYKPNPTSASFRCCCTKENNYVETTSDRDTGVWQRCDLKLQTPFVWILFLAAIKGVFSAISKLIPRRIYVNVSFLLYKLHQRYGSKKKEPMNISFDDLLGFNATIREFQYVITILKGKRENNRFLPAGIILYGHPGTGKGTFVHALARETNVSFFPVYASHIERGDVRIDRLFDEARACSPSIVYIRFMEHISERGDCESSEVLVQLHTEMEKCKHNGSIVIVIVSSDYSKNLHPFLLDSPMFLDRVHVGKPDEDARRKIIGLLLERVLREEDKEAFCDIVASQTPGLVWDEFKVLAIICEQFAASRGDVYVNMDDVIQALEKLNNNVPSNLDISMALKNMRRKVEAIGFGSQK